MESWVSLKEFEEAPGECCIVERDLVKIGAGTNRKISDKLLAAALLPSIGNLFYFVFFIIPAKHAGMNLCVLKPGKAIYSFV